MGNTAIVIVNGDLGVAGAITGPIPFVYGTTHDGGEVAQARLDLVAAYDDAAARTSIGGVVNGMTLTAGVYRAAAALDMTTLTLDGEGNPNAVFIFQIGAALTMAGSSTINLINGAQASNVFWQTGAGANVGATSSFRGTILAYAAVSLGAGDLVEGRGLSLTAAVNMDSTTIGLRISDGGYGALTGPSAFTVGTCRAFAKLFPDGGVDPSGVRVELANVDFPCAPQTPTVGALTLEASSSDGGRGQGNFVSNGSNIYVVGGAGRDFAAGSFSIRWWSGADPTKGLTGMLNVTLADGGTVVGTFAGSYCGPN